MSTNRFNFQSYSSHRIALMVSLLDKISEQYVGMRFVLRLCHIPLGVCRVTKSKAEYTEVHRPPEASTQRTQPPNLLNRPRGQLKQGIQADTHLVS